MKKLIDKLKQSVRKKDKKSYLLVFVLVLGIGFIMRVYASPGHDAPVAEVKQSDKVVVRTIGDTDPDGISKEGLGSFYGEIISKDISSINTSREGVISSWNVSIGDNVSAGDVLGYVTVTGISPDQQALIASQEANAYKARLDADAAQSVANESEAVFGKVIDNFRTITDKQKSLYDNNSSTSSNAYLTELKTLEARQISLQNKLQDFGNTAITKIFPIVSNNEQSPFRFNYYDESSLKSEISITDVSKRLAYAGFLKTDAQKTTSRTLTDSDIRELLNKTNQLIENSYQQGQLDVSGLSDTINSLQTSLREITTALDEATLAKVSKEREYRQLDIDLSKNIGGLDNELALKKLDQYSLKLKAENESKSATLLAQKLAQSAGGVIPILASRDGVIATIEKNVGEYITLSERIGYISKNNPVKMVRFTIPPTWRDIKKGDSLSLIWRADFSPGTAIITGISPTINENGGHQAEALVSKETVFPVGSSVRLVPENSKKGIFVNSKAVVFDNLVPTVWLVTENDKIRKQEITVGRQLGEYVEVLSGMEKGFKYLVILDPTFTLENGQNISNITGSTVATSTKATVSDESQPHEH